jgi:uncharacterized protein (TIGR00725 family)
MNKTITVFGSALPGEEDEQYKFAYQLGVAFAKNGFNICTGGYGGIMDAVSKGSYDNAGFVYGVTVDLWEKDPNPYITVEIREEKLLKELQNLLSSGMLMLFYKEEQELYLSLLQSGNMQTKIFNQQNQ